MKSVLRLALAALGLMSAPGAAFACACGCGVFQVGDPTLLPVAGASQIFIEYDFMDQNQNWSGSARASAADNTDKQIRTSFYNVGAQIALDHAWSVMVEVPIWNRTFVTIPDGETAPVANAHAAFGDVRLLGMWTGFSRDDSTGLLFGVKLPTGDFRYPGFDRDTAIGTGSTDLLLGGFTRGNLTHGGTLGYFGQAMFDQPVVSQDGYTPGRELDGSFGATWQAVKFGGGKAILAPVLSFIASVRARDSGPEANVEGSGYRRLIIAPGLQFAAGAWRLYGDVEIPLAQSFNGQQLAAPVLFKAVISRDF